MPVVILVLLGALLPSIRINQSSVGMYINSPAPQKGFDVNRPSRHSKSTKARLGTSFKQTISL